MEKLTFRQQILLQPIRSQAGIQIMAQFIQEDFRPVRYQALKNVGHQQKLEGAWELMGRGWLRRLKNGEYSIAGKVVDEFRKGVA